MGANRPTLVAFVEISEGRLGKAPMATTVGLVCNSEAKKHRMPVLATAISGHLLICARYCVQMASIASAARIESFTSTSRETLVAAGLISIVAHP